MIRNILPFVILPAQPLAALPYEHSISLSAGESAAQTLRFLHFKSTAGKPCAPAAEIRVLPRQ